MYYSSVNGSTDLELIFFSKEKDLAALDEDCNSPNYKDWEIKLRCTNLKSGKKHSSKSQGNNLEKIVLLQDQNEVEMIKADRANIVLLIYIR